MLCAGLFRTELIGSIVLQGLYVPLLMFVGFFQVRADTREGHELTVALNRSPTNWQHPR